jgi:hypothetical protein
VDELVVGVPGELVGEVGRFGWGRLVHGRSMVLVKVSVNVIYPIRRLTPRPPSTTYSSQLRIRLRQKLRDELVAHGDYGYPLITILSPLDWEKRQVA